MCHLLRILPVLGLCCFASGCGGGADTPQPVSGTVKFSNGKFPEFQIASINVEPVDGDATRGAGGDISSDGSYSLTTHGANGAYPGDYKVTVTIFLDYPPKTSLVAKKFTSKETTPLKATVPVGGNNSLDFTVDPAE